MTQAQCNALPAFNPSADIPSADYYNSGSNELNIYNNGTGNVSLSGYNMSGYTFDISGGSSSTSWTFNNDCIITDARVTSQGSLIYNAASGTVTVTNSLLSGVGCDLAHEATTQCVQQYTGTLNGVPNSTITNPLPTDLSLGNNGVAMHDILAGAAESIQPGPGSTFSNDYIVDNTWDDGSHAVGGQGSHNELFDINYGSSAWNGITINHNTLLLLIDSQSIYFGQMQHQGICTATNIDITNNLIAGGGTALDLCNFSTGVGSSSVTITGNDLARCATPPYYKDSTGGNQCTGGADVQTYLNAEGTSADSHGYYPDVGYFAQDGDMYCNTTNWTWSGNFYDNDGTSASC
jgi:hypothetical protein